MHPLILHIQFKEINAPIKELSTTYHNFFTFPLLLSSSVLYLNKNVPQTSPTMSTNEDYVLIKSVNRANGKWNTWREKTSDFCFELRNREKEILKTNLPSSYCKLLCTFRTQNSNKASNILTLPILPTQALGYMCILLLVLKIYFWNLQL